MGNATKKAAATQKATEASKPKRKMLTPAERIEKAKADLAALEQKAAEKAASSIKSIEEKLTAARAAKAKADKKVDDLTAELAEARVTAGVDGSETSES